MLLPPHGSKAESPASRGEIDFDGFREGRGASGRYRLDLPDGGVEEGSFSAAWCARPEVCG